jgi:hypothetical protein
MSHHHHHHHPRYKTQRAPGFHASHHMETWWGFRGTEPTSKVDVLRDELLKGTCTRIVFGYTWDFHGLSAVKLQNRGTTRWRVSLIAPPAPSRGPTRTPGELADAEAAWIWEKGTTEPHQGQLVRALAELQAACGGEGISVEDVVRLAELVSAFFERGGPRARGPRPSGGAGRVRAPAAHCLAGGVQHGLPRGCLRESSARRWLRAAAAARRRQRARRARRVML